jgi:NADH dehydrogenase
MQLYGGLGADGRLDITLLDQASRVLPAADPKTSQRSHQALQELGVTVRLAEAVASVDAEAFHLASGDKVPCTIKVWASGVTGLEVVSKLRGLSAGRGGRIVVNDDLTALGAKDVYAFGDCASAFDSAGRPIWPPTAQVAHQQADYLAKTLRRRDRGGKAKPFRYAPKGMLVSLGENDAAAEFPAWRKGGPASSAGGAIAKLFYVSLFHMHRLALHGPIRTVALALADGLRRTTIPPVKLH